MIVGKRVLGNEGFTEAGVGDLLADGTVPLTANWDVGAFTITALRFVSDVATGTAPFTVTSTTVVANLNADLLDGVEASAFLLKAGGTMTGDLDMGNQDIRMGTGLIGYDGTASEGLSFDTNGNITFEAAAGSFILPLQNDSTSPTLAFGDGDSGLHEIIDDQIGFVTAGILRFKLKNNDFLEGSGGIGAAVLKLNSTVSSTVPAHTFSSDEDTGLGRADADQLSLIAGGTEAIRLTTTAMTLYGAAVDYGADDSGGAGYKVLRVPN